MAGILALGLGAAVYPQLLAIVVVILTRPNPKRLFPRVMRERCA